MRLLMRFYDVDEGSVEIDGTDVRSYTQTSLRKEIGIVAQDTVSSSTLSYNQQNLSHLTFNIFLHIPTRFCSIRA